MINVYDIILNLLDSNRVYESFEWSKNDNIEHIKKIPMVRVTTNTLYDIINSTFLVDKSFLNEIYKKSEVYTDIGTSKIDYSVLFTDTYKVVAVEFNKEGKSLFKSYLLLDEEEEIIDLSNEIKLRNINYKIIRKNKNSYLLTREEEFRRNYLLKELKIAYKKKKYEKINYLYEEIYPKDNKSLVDKYNILLNEIEKNYNEEHDKLYRIIRLTHKKKTTLN